MPSSGQPDGVPNHWRILGGSARSTPKDVDFLDSRPVSWRLVGAVIRHPLSPAAPLAARALLAVARDPRILQHKFHDRHGQFRECRLTNWQTPWYAHNGDGPLRASADRLRNVRKVHATGGWRWDLSTDRRGLRRRLSRILDGDGSRCDGRHILTRHQTYPISNAFVSALCEGWRRAVAKAKRSRKNLEEPA